VSIQNITIPFSIFILTSVSLSRYIRQFREIFTEEGRRQVKITHKIPGQTPTVTYTQPMPSSATASQQQPVSSSNHNPTLLAQATSLAANLTAQNQPPGETLRKGVPIRLSLALNPSGIIAGKPQQGPLPGQLTVNVQQPQIHINRGIRQIGIYSGPR
jgi:hypothetical protein